MVKVLVHIVPRYIGLLEKIGRDGKASSGYSQDFQFCLNKAIEDFIKKHGEKIYEDYKEDDKK